MTFTCLFCRKQKSDKSIEHIIPNSLLSSFGSGITITWQVCGECNNGFGSTIDSEFINSSHINYLRLMHNEYLPEANRGKVIHRDSFTTLVIDQSGFSFPAVRIIRKGSIEFNPCEAPIAIPGRKERYFVREARRLSTLVQSLTAKGVPILELKILYGYMPKDFEVLNRLTASVTFPRFICKIALEYLCATFGRQVADDPAFLPLADFAYGRISALPMPYKMQIEDIDVDPLNAHYRFSKHDEHVIGVDRVRGFWRFFFSVFNVTTFSMILPAHRALTDVHNVIKLRQIPVYERLNVSLVMPVLFRVTAG